MDAEQLDDDIEQARAAIKRAEALLPQRDVAAALAELRADITNGEPLGVALHGLRRAIDRAS